MFVVPTKDEQGMKNCNVIRLITAELVTASAMFFKSSEPNTVYHYVQQSFSVKGSSVTTFNYL